MPFQADAILIGESVAYDVGAWEHQGSAVLVNCASTADVNAARDQVLAAIAGLGGWATPADLAALKTELLAAINAPRTIITGSAPVPVPQAGYVKIGSVQYDTLTAAAADIVSGSIVEVYGQLTDLAATAAFLKSCTIVGMTPDAGLKWTLGITQPMAWGKGLIVCNGVGNVYHISDLELSGARTSDANGAGVRGDECASITIQNCNLHDNENGLLSLADIHVLTGNTFKDNGNAWGTSHNVYVSFFGGVVPSLVTATGNKFYTAKRGNQFKSRAKKTVFSHNLVAELDGSCSWQIDISNGGEAQIDHNVIEQGPNAENRNLVSYAPEGLPADGRVNTLALNDNTILSDHSLEGSALVLFNQPASMSVERNIFVGNLSPVIYPVGTTVPVSNAVYADRSLAGFQPYPWLPGVPV